MTSPSVAVFGSFMMDLVSHAPRRPHAGETLVGTAFQMRTGGKGFNQAIAARRAGAFVAMAGMVGEDLFGEQFVAELIELGIDVSAIGRTAELGTGVGLPLIQPNGENSIVIVPQANTLVSDDTARRASGVIAAADVLLLQLEVPQGASIAAARIARDAGTRVMLNPAPFAPVADELMALADIVTPNEVEARQWLGAADDAPPAELARKLAEHLAADVVMTAGGHGVVVARRDADVLHLAAQPVEVVDTVGAGDTFCGNLAARLASGEDLVSAARYANAAAGIAVGRAGGASATPTREEVEGALRLACGEPVTH